MKKIMAVLLAALAMFFWGFLFWATGMGDPRDQMTHGQEKAIVAALKITGVEAGVYRIPGRNNGDDTGFQTRHKNGSLVTLSFNPDGRDVEDPAVMIAGYLHFIAIALLLSLILGRAQVNSINIFDTVLLSGLIGLTVGVATKLSDPIWMQTPLRPMLAEILYLVISFTLAGLVIALTDRTPAINRP